MYISLLLVALVVNSRKQYEAKLYVETKFKVNVSIMEGL